MLPLFPGKWGLLSIFYPWMLQNNNKHLNISNINNILYTKIMYRLEVHKMTRIAITLPQELLKEFDEVLKENGYNSRTNGLKDDIKEYVKNHRQFINSISVKTLIDY